MAVDLKYLYRINCLDIVRSGSFEFKWTNLFHLRIQGEKSVFMDWGERAVFVGWRGEYLSN